MLDTTIRSFRHQTLSNAELLVVDDCPEDTTVADVVRSHSSADRRIRLHKNHENLGYGRNFLHMLTLSRGKYVVVLGDDDLFAYQDALERYVNVFERYPDVAYVYPNMLQINENSDVDYAFRHFLSDTYFPAGIESLQATWLKSCYIPGIGLKTNTDFTDLYPRDDMLFPQVEMIGKLLANHASFGIADFLVAGRAHSGQLGFAASAGLYIKGSEKHAVIELTIIADRLTHYFEATLGMRISHEIHHIVHLFFRRAHATIFPTERLAVGVGPVTRTYLQAIRNDPRTMLDLRFGAYFLMSIVLPPGLLRWLKEARKRHFVRAHFADERRRFRDLLSEMMMTD